MSGSEKIESVECFKIAAYQISDKPISSKEMGKGPDCELIPTASKPPRGRADAKSENGEETFYARISKWRSAQRSKSKRFWIF